MSKFNFFSLKKFLSTPLTETHLQCAYLRPFTGLGSLHSVNKEKSNRHYARSITEKHVTTGWSHLRGKASALHRNVAVVASS